MNGKPDNRLDRIVNDLLRGKRLKLRAGDAEEKEAITVAARLAGARQGPQRMHAAFRKRLAQALVEPPREQRFTRRMALVAGLGLAAGAAAGGILGRATEPLSAAAVGGMAIIPDHGRWFDVAAMADLKEGQGKKVSAGSIGAFVFRKGDSVSAVSSMCSHLPCELWWSGRGAQLVCPCHPAAFTSDGKPVDAYTLPALSTVRVRVTGEGRIEVLGAE